MRVRLMKGLCSVVLAFACVAHAQDGHRIEFSIVAGAAHTDRAARLGAEEWIEPFAGIRADIRAFRTRLGVMGVQASYDRSAFGLDARVAPPCLSNCLTLPTPSDGLVAYHEAGNIHRLEVGASWQRLLVPSVRLEAAALTGVSKAAHVRRYGSTETRDPAPVQPLFGVQFGVSSLYRGFVTGVDFEFSGNARAGTIERHQNRVSLRVGHSLR